MSTVDFDSSLPIVRQVTLLEASAGTGKTYSIAGLVCRLVAEEGLPIKAILVVTFTRAAAAELRARIRARLGETAAAPDTPALHRWRLDRALDGYDEAEITTIHGFCGRVLDRHAFESGAEFDLELLGDTGELIRQIARDFYICRTHHLGALTVRSLSRLHVTPSELADIAGLTELVPNAAVHPESAVAGAFSEADVLGVIESFRSRWEAGRDQMLASLQQQCEDGILQKRGYGGGRLESKVGQVDDWLRSPTVPMGKHQSAFEALSALGLTPYKARAAQLKVPALANDIQALLGDIDMHTPLIRAVANGLRRDFVDYARHGLRERKTRARQQSYQDMLTRLEQRVSDEVAGTNLRDALRAQFKAVLIDEFQDTDPVQWRIFEAAFSGGHVPLYLVGDPKQSIYRFRGADINAYRAAADLSDLSRGLRINWRSDGPLLRALETMFGSTAAGFLGAGIDVAPVQPSPGAKDSRIQWPAPRAPLRVRRLRTPPGTRGTLNKGPCEAGVIDQVAADVVDVLGAGATVPTSHDGRRALHAGDLAVLVRTNAQARAIRERLLESGVPAVRHSADSVFASDDAVELLEVLLAVERPNQKARVRAALTTAIIGVTGTDLALLEQADAEWDEYVTLLRRVRETWEEAGFTRAFRVLMDACSTPARLGGLAGGERRITNLRHLSERVHHACTTDRLALHGAVAWLATTVEANAEEAQETDSDVLRLESDAPAVQVVTIHAAKGLEYPITFVPFLWDAPGFGADRKRNLRGNDAVRPYAPYLDVDLEQSAERDVRLAQCERAHTAESRRLAYVALTRARHHCVVYLAPYSKLPTSPLAGLVFAGEPDPAAVKGDTAIAAALDRLAGRSEATIGADAFDVGARSAAPTSAVGGAVQARKFTRRRFDTWWRRTSFSQLRKGPEGALVPQAPGRGAADEAEEADVAETADAAEPVALADFERSARFGDVIHDAFEHHDFTAGVDALEHGVATQIRRHRLPNADAALLAAGLQTSLETTLPGGFTLGDVPVADTLKELAFHIPIAGGERAGNRGWLTSASLARIFEEHRAQPGPVTDAAVTSIRQRRFFPVQGYLYGLMDLVARRDGRYYLVDYKSSYLGPTAADYGPQALARHMAEHQYLLQYHLYLVALHRYLQRRVANYGYERDFGGVLYLFVRGMVGQGDTGIFFDRPPARLVDALSEHFEHPGVGADE